MPVETVYVAVAVAIAKAAEEFLAVVAAASAIIVAVEGGARLIVNLVAVDEQSVAAVEERTADDSPAAKSQYGHCAAIDLRESDSQCDPPAALVDQLESPWVKCDGAIEVDRDAVDL